MMYQPDLLKLNTLIKVRENTLLSSQRKKSLIQAGDMKSALSLLKEWDFFLLPVKNSDKDILDSLSDERKAWVLWVEELAPHIKAAEFFLMAEKIHDLKIFLKELLTEKSFSHLYTENLSYKKEDFYSLTEQEDIKSEMPGHWKKKVRSVMDDYKIYRSLSRIDFIMDAFYYEELIRIASELSDPDINDIVNCMIDLYNISVILQSEYTGYEVPSAVWAKGGYLKDSLSKIISADAGEKNAFFMSSRYSYVWEKLMQDKNPLLFDVYKDDYIISLCKNAKLKAFGIFPVYAFLFAKTADIKAVQLILTGKSYSVREQEIEKRVCISYEL